MYHNKLPVKYYWLKKENSPKMIVEGLKLYGIKETNGYDDNPEVIKWADEVGIVGYTHDSIPWCGLFVSICASRSGKPLPRSPLWALSWAQWGERVEHPELGDVLVFKRRHGGHVALYVGEDGTAYHCLGGNQGDAVSIARIDKSRCVAIRRLYRGQKPPNVRPIKLAANGRLSENEE